MGNIGRVTDTESIVVSRTADAGVRFGHARRAASGVTPCLRWGFLTFWPAG